MCLRTLSMKSERTILAHLWKDTRTGEWYCSGQPFGPSPGSSISLLRFSASEEVDQDLVEGTEETSVESASGIRETMEFKFCCNSTRIALSSSISRRVKGLVPSWIFRIRRTAPIELILDFLCHYFALIKTYEPSYTFPGLPDSIR